jgi:hypothetical protein
MKNYCVMLYAPVTVRIRAKNKAQAVDRAILEMTGREEIALKRGVDFDEAWIEEEPWKHRAADSVDGGVFLSESQDDLSVTINPTDGATKLAQVLTSRAAGRRS